MTQATELRELASLIRVNNGNVGIGSLTADPPYTLSLGQTNVAGAQTIRLAGNGNPKHEIQFREAGVGYGFTFRYAGDATDNKLHIVQHENSTNGTEIMTFKRDSMEVGIGTDSPDLLYEGLHIKSANPSLKIEGTGTSSWEFIHLKQPNYDRLIGMRTTGNIVINSGTNLDANNMLVIDTAGKVGVNVENPVHDLDVNGAIATRQVRHSIRPTLNLDFANSKELDSRITFYRDSIATYYDSKGILRYSNINEPRFDHDPDTGESKGLLIEEARANIFNYTNNPERWPLMSAASSDPIVNSVLSPDGTMNATKLIVTGSDPYFYQNNLTLNGTYTFSFWIKAFGSTVGKHYTVRGANIGTSFSIAPSGGLPSEWTRITHTFTSGSTSTAYIGVEAVDNSPANGDELSIWGAQLELGSFATSLAPSDDKFISRSSVATYYDETGILRTAPVNGARYGYKYDGRKWVETGLILEGASTNIATYSSKLDSVWSTVGGTVALDRSVTAPDGTDNVYGFTASTASTAHNIRQSHGGLTAGSTHTVSIWMRAKGSQTHAGMYVGGPNHSCVFANINTTTPSIIDVVGLENVSIEYQTNGWHRIEFTTVAGSGGNVNPIWTLRDSTTEVFAGDGTQGFYLWGYQVEAQYYATSFIYTDSATKTRSADVASSVAYTREADNAYMDNIQSYDWYSHDSGTLFAEHNVDRDIDGSAWGIVTLENEGSSDNYVGLRYRSSGTSGEVLSSDGVSQISASAIPAADLNYFNKAAIAYETNSAAAVGNGGTVSTDSSVIVPNLTQLTIGTGYGINYIGGHIKKIAYYSERLTNSEIQALTENN